MKRVHVTRDSEGNIQVSACADGESVGIVKPLSEGEPIHTGESIVKLTLEGDGLHAQLEYIYDGRDGRDARGPAQVATSKYRENYDRTFN